MNFGNDSTSLHNNTNEEMLNLQPWFVSAIIVDGLVISMNIIQLALLLKKWSHLDRTEHLLVSLCISDLICGITMFGQDAFYLKEFLDEGKINPTDLENMILDCLLMFFVLVSNFHIVALAIERLVAVSFPMNYNMFTTLKCKTFTICLVWTLSVLVAPTVTVVQKIENDEHKGNYKGQRIIGGVLLVACITVFSIYMILVFALWRREQKMKELIPEELHRQLRDRKTTMICLLFGVAFLVCILPYTISLLDNKLYHYSFNLLVTSNQFLNPMIYFFKLYAERRRSMSAASQSRLLPRDRTFLTEANGETSPY